MIGELPLPEPESADEAELLEALDRKGWIGMGVSPNVTDPSGTPPFAYTAGLERTWGHPELLVVGIPWPAAGQVLRGAVERVRDGESFEPGPRYGGLVAAGDAVFVPVSHAHRIFTMTYAMWLYHGRDDFRALQLVWPDRAGRYPWDEDYDRVEFGEQEDLSEDVHDLRHAAEGGDLDAAKRLGDIWWRYRQLKSAERYYRTLVDAGRTDGLVGLGLVLEAKGECDQALELYGRAAANGEADGQRFLNALTQRRVAGGDEVA